MTHNILKKKILAESELYQFGIGTYRVYSFLMEELNDHNQVKRFMLNENYTHDEISRAKNGYNRSISKSRALVADRVF